MLVGVGVEVRVGGAVADKVLVGAGVVLATVGPGKALGAGVGGVTPAGTVLVAVGGKMGVATMGVRPGVGVLLARVVTGNVLAVVGWGAVVGAGRSPMTAGNVAKTIGLPLSANSKAGKGLGWIKRVT